MNTDNPAGRLLHILQECKKIQPQTTGREAWRKILGKRGQVFTIY